MRLIKASFCRTSRPMSILYVSRYPVTPYRRFRSDGPHVHGMFFIGQICFPRFYHKRFPLNDNSRNHTFEKEAMPNILPKTLFSILIYALNCKFYKNGLIMFSLNLELVIKLTKILFFIIFNIYQFAKFISIFLQYTYMKFIKRNLNKEKMRLL